MFKQQPISTYPSGSLIRVAEIIFCMRPANERRRYNVTSSPIGWAHTENDPCSSASTKQPGRIWVNRSSEFTKNYDSNKNKHDKTKPCSVVWDTAWDYYYCIIISDIQSSAVITRSNIVRYYMNDYRNGGRISIRCWIHKRHPIPRPNGWAIGCLLRIFVRKLTALQRHRTVIHRVAVDSLNECLV